MAKKSKRLAKVKSTGSREIKTRSSCYFSEELERLQKKFGKSTISTLDGKRSDQDTLKGISWSIPSFNYICTGRIDIGIVFGRIYELFGPESSGKTTLCIQAIIEAQKRKLKCVFIDAEHAFDPRYAKSLGLDIKNIIFTQPDSGEEVFEIAEACIQEKFDLIIVDSVDAIQPSHVINATYEKQKIGSQAQLMSMALRKLSKLASKSGTAIIFTNQIRDKIGVMFGSPETTPGGKALKFYASVRLRVEMSFAKSKAIRGAVGAITGTGKDKTRIGANCKIENKKNKIFRPFYDTLVSVIYGKGFDGTKDLYDFAARAGIIVKTKMGYRYGKKSITNSNLENYEKEIFDELLLMDLDSVIPVYESESGSDEPDAEME